MILSHMTFRWRKKGSNCKVRTLQQPTSNYKSLNNRLSMILKKYGDREGCNFFHINLHVANMLFLF